MRIVAEVLYRTADVLDAVGKFFWDRDRPPLHSPRPPRHPMKRSARGLHR